MKVQIYDWRALQRWGISESRLPSGSSVHFRQSSIWEVYRWHILGAVILLIFQAGLIARLLIQKRRRERAERELLKSEQRLRLITNALPVLIAYVDSDQRYRFNNDAYKAWFGVSAEDASGRTIRKVVGEQFYRSVLPYLERAFSGEQVRYSQQIELGEGRTVSLEAIYVPDMQEIKEILHDIVKEDTRAGEVINRLRALYKREKSVFELLDLNVVFREMVGLMHSEAVIRNVKISSELDPLLPSTQGGP